MADVVTIVETAGTAVSGTAVIGGLLGRRFLKARDQRSADDLFLHGLAARPGIPEIAPAGDRLSAVETGVNSANDKIDDANKKLDRLVDEVDFQLHQDGGNSLRDRVEQLVSTNEAIVAEQARVADALSDGPTKENPK